MIKFNNKSTITLAFIFTAVVLMAQSAGYMGKKLSAGYGFYASPGLIGSSGATPLNMLHEAYLEVAAKRKLSIGFSARFYNAVYGNNRQVDLYSYTSSSINQIDDSPTGQTHIKGRNYMLYFKFFGNNYVAPWGRYFILGASVNTFQSSYNPSDMRIRVSTYYNYPISDYKDSYYSNFGSTEQTFAKFDVMLGFGRCRIIANRITLDYGYNVNLMALALTLFDAPDDNIFESDVLTPSTYIEKTSAARVRGVNRFNVFLKVGVLLF